MSNFLDLSDLVDAEETPEPFRFIVHGEKFEVSTDMQPEQRKLMSRAQQDENVEDLLGAIFGADELARLDDMKLSLAQYWRIIEAYNEFLDTTGRLTLGESSASTRSSGSTGKKSKPTSRTTSHR